MATIRNFEEIEAWQLARELVHRIYDDTRRDDFRRDFGLRDQIRRAGVSIMANIAEGFERDGNPEFVQFLSLAKASAGEVRSHLYVALDAGYIARDEFDRLTSLVRSIASAIAHLMAYLKASDLRGRKYR